MITCVQRASDYELFRIPADLLITVSRHVTSFGNRTTESMLKNGVTPEFVVHPKAPETKTRMQVVYMRGDFRKQCEGDRKVTQGR